MEDDAYGFLSYEAEALPAIRSLDERWVFYIGSFSKILAPALRAGWIVVPEELMAGLSIVKESTDIDTSTFTQRAITSFLDAGYLEQHINTLCEEYRRRRDAMIESLEEHLKDYAGWKRASGGVFVWVELEKEMDSMRLLVKAIEQERVAFIPGRAFSITRSGSGANCMRLNFSGSSADRIRDGVSRLGRVIKQAYRSAY
jgi:2-aminoadipate transaminase